MPRRPTSTRPPCGLRATIVLAVAAILLGAGCQEAPLDFDPGSPARGPGGMVGGAPLNTEMFPGGDDPRPEPRQVTPPSGNMPPDCGPDCLEYCDALGLQNPVNRGMCESTWGVGLTTLPVDRAEACRRLFVDLTGRFPTHHEVEQTCAGDRSFGEVAWGLLQTDDFVRVNRRLWADRLLYNNESVSVERIFDADRLVAKLYRGEVAYDEFAAVISAHPVLTRRHATAGDRAEAVFWLLMGRPPLGSERSDLGRLYSLWHNGYYDHPQLGERLPDAFIRYRCVTEAGEIDAQTRGECTSVLWGYNELILMPDLRADGEPGDERMWSGLLTAQEWAELATPGRLLATERAFWEKAVDDVIDQYLGYELGALSPRVRDELIEDLLAHDADIRSVHFAVVTSQAYLQSNTGATPTDHRWTRGPLKQVHAEAWLESIETTAGIELGDCDHRIPEPNRLLDNGRIAARAVVEQSAWPVDADGEVDEGFVALARSLGGCPRNDVGGRFRIVSILTTAKQLGFVGRVCDPTFDPDVEGADIGELLPGGVNPQHAVDGEMGARIVDHQTRLFYGRRATSHELERARGFGEACARSVCTAEEFARPSCYALLSSSEMLFY